MSMQKAERRTGWPLERWFTDEGFDRIVRDFFRGEPGLMRVEEFTEDGACVIRAELPGIDPEKDVELSVVDGMLHIEARREERTEEKQPHGYRSEFRYGTFTRSIRLPKGATEKDVTATYKDGILEVRVPTPPQVEQPAAKIPVQRS